MDNEENKQDDAVVATPVTEADEGQQAEQPAEEETEEQGETVQATEPAAEVTQIETPTAIAADATPTPEVVSDTVTPTAPAVTPEPAVVTPQVEEPTEEAPAAPAVVDSDPNVAKLLELLNRFKDKNTQPGKEPEHFVESAKAALAITKHVIAKPKLPVLDALLAFFVAEKNGVCVAVEYLKGSTTLAKFDEQKVGLLFNLFSDLASKRTTPVNAASVAGILGGQEIVTYYNRKRTGFAKAR